MFEVFPGYNATPMTELAMQLPMYSYSTPFAPDWNHDGVPDLWHHNHYQFSEDLTRWSDPGIRRYGPGMRAPGGCLVDWDAVIRNNKAGTWYAPNGGKGFLEWTDKTKKKCFDVHSTTFLDIDGDGVYDLFLTTGGGRGRGTTPEFDNAIFWGEKDGSPLGYKLVGGRDAALAAGIDGRNEKNLNERGRHQYWLDVDGDGLLDVITLNQERSDKIPVPSQLNRATGKRKYVRAAKDFDDFANVALLADVDGDGYAREMIVPSACDKVKKNRKTNAICTRSPTGTISVYRLDPNRYLVRESMSLPRADFVKTAVAGDFDHDGVADIALQYSKYIAFYLSSARKRRCQSKPSAQRKNCLLTLDEPDDVLDIKPVCGTRLPSAGMRLADFNLDGNLDILVVCETPGLHAIFEQLPNGKWRKLQDSRGNEIGMGRLASSNDLAHGGRKFCDGIPTTTAKLGLKSSCEAKFSKSACRNVRYNIQFVLCSRYTKKSTPSTAFTIGATVADLNNDGFADAIVAHRFGSAVMFRNTLGDRGNKNRFIAVRVDKRAGAAASVGAIVKLRARRMGPNQNEVTTQMRVVSSLSHLADADGGSEDRLIFGLGAKGIPASLEVHWPHCCELFTVGRSTLMNFLDSMDSPYVVPPPPKNCDKSCLQ